MTDPTTEHRVTVVVASRDRRDALLATLPRHEGPVILVDNGSTDGTADAVRRHHPDVDLVELGVNRGAVGRTVGVRRARTPYVAFADDDSWWEPGALSRASDLFDRHPRLGLLGGRVLVGPDRRLDPVSAAMRDSPLGREPDLPGPSVLGFLACGTVVRREAYLQAGGFDPLLFFFGEEELLALDLAAAGWGLCYADGVVAHHHPQASARDPGHRQQLAGRNRLLTALLRRPWPVVARTALATLRQGPHGRRATGAALARMAPALSRRRPLPPALEAARRRLVEV
jgi:GT2 family glycosyltransferase